MAETTDMAPTRATTSARRTSSNGGRSSRARSHARNDDALEAQIARLQTDLKAIAATIAGMADEKVSEASGTAKTEVRNLVRQGQHAVEEMQDEFGQVKKQVKDTIRQKPLTAVIGALAVGFVLALLTR